MNYEDIEVGKEYLIRVRVVDKQRGEWEGEKYIFVEPIDENGEEIDPPEVYAREFWGTHTPAFIPCDKINR